jgi:hypothetical protein
MKLIFIVLFLFLISDTLSQETENKGLTIFDVNYIAKDPKVKTKDLINRFGYIEKIYWTEDEAKCVVLSYSDTVTVIHRKFDEASEYVKRVDDKYFIKYPLEPDLSILNEKLSESANINGIECDVYHNSKTRSTAYITRGAPSHIGHSPNYKELRKVVLERNEYFIIKEFNEHTNINDFENTLKINREYIVHPVDQCMNYEKLDSTYQTLIECMEEKTNYLSIYSLNLEGGVIFSFIINNDGTPINPRVTPVFFKKIYDFHVINNPKKINRINRSFENKILRKYKKCVSKLNFDPPLLDNNPIKIIFEYSMKF